MTPGRPVPLPDVLTQPFWTAACEHRLVAARCAACDEMSLPPDVVCARCSTPDPAWTWCDLSGVGRLRAWTVVTRAFLPGFDEPPVVIDVELDDQSDLRLISRLIGADPEGLTSGVPVRVVFDDVADGVTLPVFELVTAT